MITSLTLVEELSCLATAVNSGPSVRSIRCLDARGGHWPVEISEQMNENWQARCSCIRIQILENYQAYFFYRVRTFKTAEL